MTDCKENNWQSFFVSVYTICITSVETLIDSKILLSEAFVQFGQKCYIDWSEQCFEDHFRMTVIIMSNVRKWNFQLITLKNKWSQIRLNRNWSSASENDNSRNDDCRRWWYISLICICKVDMKIKFPKFWVTKCQLDNKKKVIPFYFGIKHLSPRQ